MQYCADKTCKGSNHFYEDEDKVCSKCTKELVPCIQCLCGDYEVNPYGLDAKACPKCGAYLSHEYLGRCMAVQLRGLVKEVAGKLAGLN